MKLTICSIALLTVATLVAPTACGKKDETPTKAPAAEAPKAGDPAKVAEPAAAPAAAPAVAAAPAAPAAAPEGLDAKVMELVTKGDARSLAEALEMGLPFLLTAKVADGAYADDQKIVPATSYAFNQWWAFIIDATKPEADRTFARMFMRLKLATALGDVTHAALHSVIGEKTVALLALDPGSRMGFLSKVAARTDKALINLDMMVIRDLYRTLPALLPKDAPLPSACAELSTEVLLTTNSRDVEEAFVSMWGNSDCVAKLAAPQKDAAAKVLDEHFDRLNPIARDAAIRAYAAMCAKKELTAQLERLKTGAVAEKASLVELGTALLAGSKCE